MAFIPEVLGSLVFVIPYHHDWLKASHCHLFNLLFFSNNIYLNMTLLSYFSCLVVAVAFFDMALWPYPIFFKSSFLFFTCDSYCTTSSLAHGLICLHLASLDLWYHSLVSYILLLMKGPTFLVGLYHLAPKLFFSFLDVGCSSTHLRFLSSTHAIIP